MTIQVLNQQEGGEVVTASSVKRNVDQDPNNGGFTTFTIPEDDLQIDTVARRVISEDPDTFRLTTTADWLIDPLQEYTDTIALQWSDNFTMGEDLGYIVNEDGDRDYYDAVRNDVVPEKGVAWDLDLNLNQDETGAVLEAIVTKPDSSGTANVVGEYGHVQVRPSDVRVGFSSSGVDMTVGLAATVNQASPDYDYFEY